MFTDEEKTSVFICGSIFRIRISAEGLAATMIKAKIGLDHRCGPATFVSRILDILRG
jgi:hypothetical protein